MLGLAGHNPMGNVLHIIAGPETDVFTDIHGAKILDITDILAVMNPKDRVYISLTRCKSEADTEIALAEAGTKYRSSFNNGENAKKDAEDAEAEHDILLAALKRMAPTGLPEPTPEMKADVKKMLDKMIGKKKSTVKRRAKPAAVAKCSFCKRETELLGVPGFKICKVCAQIEIGKNIKKDSNA